MRDPAGRSGAIGAIFPTRCTSAAAPVNRGFAVLGDRLFMTTVDAHLLALDMKTGAVLFDVMLEDYKRGYSATVAPLVVKDKVILGIAGAEYGIRGFIEAFDAQTGKKIWRFYTVAGPGESGGNTWPKTDAYLRGGGSIWVTGTYDPEQNLVFFGTGNPGPDYYSAQPRRRQPVYRVDCRARRRHRQAAVALSVHAARRARLGRDAGAGPWRADRSTASRARS